MTELEERFDEGRFVATKWLGEGQSHFSVEHRLREAKHLAGLARSNGQKGNVAFWEGQQHSLEKWLALNAGR